MKKSFYNSASILGFCGCFCLFVFLNYQNYLTSYNEWEKEPGYIVGRYEFGYPFDAYYKIIGSSEVGILWNGLLANVLVALICSFVVGLIFKLIWAKITSRFYSLK
jgi:hypothetical protein